MEISDIWGFKLPKLFEIECYTQHRKFTIPCSPVMRIILAVLLLISNMVLNRANGLVNCTLICWAFKKILKIVNVNPACRFRVLKRHYIGHKKVGR